MDHPPFQSLIRSQLRVGRGEFDDHALQIAPLQRSVRYLIDHLDATDVLIPKPGTPAPPSHVADDQWQVEESGVGEGVPQHLPPTFHGATVDGHDLRHLFPRSVVRYSRVRLTLRLMHLLYPMVPGPIYFSTLNLIN